MHIAEKAQGLQRIIENPKELDIKYANNSDIRISIWHYEEGTLFVISKFKFKIRDLILNLGFSFGKRATKIDVGNPFISQQS